MEEQQNEIEALESIYPDEFQGKNHHMVDYFDLVNKNHVAISEKEFKISIYPDEQDEDQPRKYKKGVSAWKGFNTNFFYFFFE